MKLCQLLVYLLLGLKAPLTSVKYEEPITLIIKTDHSFIHLRFQKFV